MQSKRSHDKYSALPGCLASKFIYSENQRTGELASAPGGIMCNLEIAFTSNSSFHPQRAVCELWYFYGPSRQRARDGAWVIWSREIGCRENDVLIWKSSLVSKIYEKNWGLWGFDYNFIGRKMLDVFCGFTILLL